VVLILGACIVAGPIWLPAIGRWLILSGGEANLSAARADVIGIPDSAWVSSTIGADRALFASEWIRQGRAQWVVMTCGPVYGVSGCELAQESLVARGKPKLPLREVPLPSSPAPVEAAALLAEVARMGAKSATILVDPLVSRRMNRVYQREGKKRGIEVTVLFVPYPGLRAADWWRMREARKAVLFELSQWAGIP
jgi:hypothetical protein